MTLMPFRDAPGCEPGLIPIDCGSRRRQPRGVNTTTRTERRPITMPGILALVLLAIAAVIVLSFAVHMLPWLLAAVAIVALVKFWPRRSHR